MFSWRSKIDISIFRMNNVPYLLLCMIREMVRLVGTSLAVLIVKDPILFTQTAKVNTQADLNCNWI